MVIGWAAGSFFAREAPETAVGEAVVITLEKSNSSAQP